ncbi:hypothetical protein AAEX28_06520 [Lentisphaerota bacterium WC36G]|nr:hypothetical protein LJT99_09385 [Lentisphaerae bacterium WC36]
MKLKKINYFNLTELIVIIFILLIITILTVPLLEPTCRPRERKISCASNLKVIGTALIMYSLEHDDQFPRTTAPKATYYNRDRLLKNYNIANNDYFTGTNLAGTSAGNFEELRLDGVLKDTTAFLCPQSSDNAAKKDKAMKYEQTSYAYAFGMVANENITKMTPDSGVVADAIDSKLNNPKTNHENFGNILYLDIHVAGYKGATWYKNSGMWQNKAPTKILQTTDEMFNDSTLHSTPTMPIQKTKIETTP